MIQDIHPRRIDLAFGPRRPNDGDYVIALRGSKVLLAATPEQPTLLRHADVKKTYKGDASRYIYLFTLDGAGFFLLDGDVPETPALAFHDTMIFRTYQPSWLAFAGVTAAHLAGWYRLNRFCGACGAPMAHKADERAMSCPACGNIVYPRISPAVIVAVTDGSRLLMTRYANRPGARMALVAGFMEIGETFENTVEREVMEEVGLGVKNIRYYKSQPWAFSGSVLTGFFCDLDGAPDITLDTVELQEGVWVERPDIPEGDTSVSLTSEMIDVFRRNAVP